MFGKLALIVIVAGLTAIGLLVARHHRIELAHEMTRIHHDMIEQERALWELRGEISRRCRPEEVRRLIESIPVEWQPIPRDGEPKPVTAGPVVAFTDEPVDPAGG